jgi:DNA-binding transcriptional ArsR family regulator
MMIHNTRTIQQNGLICVTSIPDYELEETRVVGSPEELKAMAHPIRSAVLDLLLERAATVAELAAAVGVPRSTMAHHVKVLVDAGLLAVVRTRRVRAIDERYYGRTARLFQVGAVSAADAEWLGAGQSPLGEAAAEADAAHREDRLRATLRHARIPEELAVEFWDRVVELAQDFARLPRSGDTTFGFVAGIYQTNHPTLPEQGDQT